MKNRSSTSNNNKKKTPNNQKLNGKVQKTSK